MKHNYNSNNNKKAFTLIELLIVIAIIGILFIVLVSKVDFATDKAKATGVQTDFRSFQVALDQVAKENAGFNIFGWDTGDVNGDRIRNSYDRGDANKNGIEDPGETFIGRKEYGEDWTTIYTMLNPKVGMENDDSAFVALETAINANLDPKLHITITPDVEGGVLTGNATITMANQARDPWKNEYHGVFITNAARDNGADRGAIIMYSDGANGKWGSAHDITNGVVSVTVPYNNKLGQDDYSLVSCYTYVNGYGEVKNMTTGFSNNQAFLNGNNSSVVPGGNGGTEPDVNEPIPAHFTATFDDGTTLTWEKLQLPENGDKYGYDASKITNTSIGDEAFFCCNSIVTIMIPDSVTSIGDSAFDWCTSLTSVIIPDSVTSIGDEAFHYCTSLTSVVIPDSVTSIGSSAFYECSSLESVVVGNGVETIGDSAFDTCENLISVNIPNSVKSIGKWAFYYCTSLTSITIPDSVTSIRDYAFQGCSSLTEIKVDSSNANYMDIDGNLYTKDGKTLIQYAAGKSDASFTIPDSVTSICGWAFYYCTSLESVVIPDSVTTIGSAAFAYCSILTSVIIPDSVTSIGDRAFQYCDSLESITYSGTLSQWNAISKGKDWNDCTGDYTINYNTN